MKRLLTGACVATIAFILVGCSRPTATPAEIEPKEHPLGIVSVQRDGTNLMLTVVLKDQLKLQLIDGETPGPMCWIQSNTPTPFLIALGNGTLKMGVATESWNTSGVKILSSFPNLPPGTREVAIAERDVDGRSEPIVVRLVPTTPAERQAINKGEPSAGAYGLPPAAQP